MSAPLVSRPAPHEQVRWLPRQHGAWAMLAVPFLLGIAASRPSAWQLLLALTAVSGYLASGAVLDWTRARRAAYGPPALVFGTLFALSGVLLLVAFPALLPVAAVVGAAAALVLGVTVAGHPRSLLASLGQASEAVVLVPAAALVSGAPVWLPVARATLVAGLYLVSSILVVRSMIRERGHRDFAALSLGYHVGAVALEAWLLAPAYAALAAAFLLRAATLPWLQARLASGPRHLRPIHVGLVELATAVALVLVAFCVRF
ncbi:MAG: YwiC-like family protein [Candidatus Limnocylindrales bacterium]